MTNTSTTKLNAKAIALAICSAYEWYELRELEYTDVQGWIENNYGWDIEMTLDEVNNLINDLKNNNWEFYWYE